jgi:hypothetical protein
MHLLFLLQEPAEHDCRTMILVMVGVLLVVALLDSLAGGMLKRLDNAGRTHASKKRKHRQGK